MSPRKFRAPGPSAWHWRWLCCLLLGQLIGCAGLPSAAAPQRLAEGVYWWPGSGGVADADNRGRIGNAGFIVGPLGVLAIDTGTSLAHGRALLAAIRSVTASRCGWH